MAAALKSLFSRFAYSNVEPEVSRKSNRKEDSGDDAFTTVLGPFESYVVTIQSILIWENPLASCLTLVLFNVLFWVIVSFQFRFYFVVAVATAVIYFYRTWVNQIWPEIRVPVPEGEDTEEWTPVNPQVLSVPEISRYLNKMAESATDWYAWLFDLRQRKPGQFCVLVTSTLVIVAIIGHYVTGVFMAYAIMMGVMLAPAFFVHIYPALKSFVASGAFMGACALQMMDEYNDAYTEKVPDPDGLDEFLPESDKETMETLSNVLEESRKDEKEDSDSIAASKDLGLEDLNPNGL